MSQTFPPRGSTGFWLTDRSCVLAKMANSAGIRPSHGDGAGNVNGPDAPPAAWFGRVSQPLLALARLWLTADSGAGRHEFARRWRRGSWSSAVHGSESIRKLPPAATYHPPILPDNAESLRSRPRTCFMAASPFTPPSWHPENRLCRWDYCGAAEARVSNTTGTNNTAMGLGALFSNTGNQNTATGAGALVMRPDWAPPNRRTRMACY